MPIRLPSDLPAFDVLTREGVMVMAEDQAAKQDIRPLKIGLLNLMPKKIQTENQFARLIGATPLQIDLHLIRMSEHETRNTAAEHMEAFYRPFRDVRHEKFDGLIITGAPIEHLPFEEVTYWDELKEVMDWTQTNVHMTFGVCWGGMAMINYSTTFNHRPTAAELHHSRLEAARRLTSDVTIIYDWGRSAWPHSSTKGRPRRQATSASSTGWP